MSFTTQLSPSDLKLVFDRFKALYGTYGAPGLKDNTQLFTQEWYSALKGFSANEVTQAVNAWIGSSKDQWPKPGQLRAMVYAQRGEQNQAQVSHQRPTCRCGDVSCDLRLYQTPSGVPRLYMDCVARRDGLAPA